MLGWMPVVATVVGLLLWVLPMPPVIQKAGEILFATGMLSILLAAALTNGPRVLR